MRSIKTIRKDIKDTKEALSGSSLPEKFRDEMKQQLVDLEKELEEAEKNPENNEGGSAAKSTPVKKIPKPEEPVKFVTIDGHRFIEDSAEHCAYLKSKVDKRKSSLKKNTKHAKTPPIFSAVTAKIGLGAIKAIRYDMRVNKEDMDEHPEKYIARYKKLRTATKEYLRSFKTIMGEKFRTTEIDKLDKEIEHILDKLEKKAAEK